MFDTDVTVFFERDSYGVSETDGRVEICVVRDGDVSQSLTVQVSTGDFVPLQAEGNHHATAF